MKIELQYYSCSRAAKEKCGEIVGYYHGQTFDNMMDAQDHLTLLQNDKSSIISQIEFYEIYDTSELEYEFKFEYVDKKGKTQFVCYRNNDFASTSRAYQKTLKAKNPSNVSTFSVCKKIA